MSCPHFNTFTKACEFVVFELAHKKMFNCVTFFSFTIDFKNTGPIKFIIFKGAFIEDIVLLFKCRVVTRSHQFRMMVNLTWIVDHFTITRTLTSNSCALINTFIFRFNKIFKLKVCSFISVLILRKVICSFLIIIFNFWVDLIRNYSKYFELSVNEFDDWEDCRSMSNSSCWESFW